LHMAQLMPLPLTISCSSKSRLVLPSWFYLFGAGLPGWSRTEPKRAVKWLCVCVHVCVTCCVLVSKTCMLHVAVFNVGEYRRRVVANFTHTNSAEFFHPDNVEANAIRELVSVMSICTVLLSISCYHLIF